MRSTRAARSVALLLLLLVLSAASGCRKKPAAPDAAVATDTDASLDAGTAIVSDAGAGEAGTAIVDAGTPVMTFVPDAEAFPLARKVDLMTSELVLVNGKPRFVLKDGRELRRMNGEVIYAIAPDGKIGDGMRFKGDVLVNGAARGTIDGTGVVKMRGKVVGKFDSPPNAKRTAMLVVLASQMADFQLASEAMHARLDRVTTEINAADADCGECVIYEAGPPPSTDLPAPKKKK